MKAVLYAFFGKNPFARAKQELSHLKQASNFQLPTQVSKPKHLPLRKHFPLGCAINREQDGHMLNTALNSDSLLLLFTLLLCH